MILTWEGWLTIAVIGLVLFALASGRLSPVATLFSGLAVLITTAALTGSERLIDASALAAGFGSTGLITVGLLFVVAQG